METLFRVADRAPDDGRTDGSLPMSRLRTGVLAAILVFAVVVAGASALALWESDGPGDRTQGSLTANWVSDTGRNVTGNHHVAVGGQPSGQPMVFAPISGEPGQGDAGHNHAGHDHDHGAAGECGLVALNGTDGAARWSYEVPPENCTIHAVADPTLADVDGDGEQEVLATSTERTVVAFDPETGDVELEHNLSAYGYTRPLVADLTGDGNRELVVVDANANVFVVGPDGEEIWTNRLPASYVWGQPHVDDFDGDGDAELAVALGEGELYLLDGDGSVAWNRSVGAGETVTWFTAGQADDDASTELVAATTGGNVSLYDGDGSLVWREDLGSFAAVEAVGDGDGDGTPEVYATARDGTLRALDGPTGEVEWTTELTTDDVQMMPPPILADADDDDGDPELVAASNDGRVAVLDPASGETLAAYERETPIWTYPTVADVDDDPAPELLVMYGDGRVATLSYEESESE